MKSTHFKLAHPATTWPSIGIAARLGIAFAVVLLFVLTTTYFAREASRRAARSAAIITTQHEPLARVAQELSDAAATFDRTVLDLAKPDATANPKRIDAGIAHIERLASEYHRLSPDAKAVVEGVLEKAAMHERRARELLLLAQRRRTLVTSYWKSFQALAKEVHAAESSLSVAPHAPMQTHLSLVQAVGRMQDSFGAYVSAGGKDTERIVAEAEAGFRMAFDRSHAALVKSLGSEHVAKLRAQFEKTIAARRALVALNSLLKPANQAFLQTGTELSELIILEIADPARRALVAAAVDASEVSRKVDHALNWFGVGTLLFLVVISIATVHGVVIPVRKLIGATRRLADGERGYRVPRGGISELDRLAAAFNYMSAQLEHAEELVRHYQTQLEKRVDERTRQLQYLAHHDPLTQLPNRRQLSSYLQEALQRARTNDARVGLLFLDLDNFKTVNDSLGHEIGDRLLKGVSERLLAVVGGHAFAARLGGDEFTVVCESVESVEAVDALGRALVEQFQRPLSVEGRELAVGMSVGASVFPDHAQDAASLLSAADAALFRAKECGRNRHSVFSAELLQAASVRFETEQQLRRAIEKDEFVLLYQPQIDLDRAGLSAVEALIRWRHPSGRLVSPAEFLPIAEQSGLINEISYWILDTGVKTVAEWYRDGWVEARLALNLSSQQLMDGAFLVRLEDTLRKHALPPACLEVELTETVLQTGASTIEALHWLRSLGVAIALDDFGTGYSSLTSIEQLPLTRVKLDRSLIANVEGNKRCAAIVRSIITLCRSLNLKVTAEGVETRAQLAFLLAHAPIEVQGFLLSAPTSIGRFSAFESELSARVRDVIAMMPRIDASGSVSDSMILRQLHVIGGPNTASHTQTRSDAIELP